MANILDKIMQEYTPEEKSRGFELFVEDHTEWSREEAQAVWDRMNGNRYHYYWDAHEENTNV